MKTFVLGLLATISVTAAAHAAPARTGERQASIDFVDSEAIRDWRATDERTLYLKDVGVHWYRATFSGPCPNLLFAQTIGFDTGPTHRFDNFSAVLVRGLRCSVDSVVASAEPPPKPKRNRR